ncbi:MAG: FtsH protease activity modulator HflK [Alphaproteobacteria bacterium]|nr:FtsH protease activity modulator HflK [Alphaproteobacteria bacterium]
MPWKQQGGGGWQGSGRGPWGRDGGGGGTGGGGSGNDNSGPDLEELLRRSQDRFRRAMPRGGLGPLAFLFILLAAVFGWAMTGWYLVGTAERGVETTFGDYTGTLTEPGLHYHIPWPVQAVQKVNVNEINKVEITDVGAGRRGSVPSDSLMLTGDENIVDMDFNVQWQVADPAAYVFNVEDPDDTVLAVAESVMREVVGRTTFQSVLNERGPIEEEVRAAMQAVLDEYKSGVRIVLVNMAKVDPPGAVIEDYRDVQRARTDQERVQNEAEAYRNKIVPEARGQAQQILQEAQAYRDQTIAEASGQAERFTKIYNEYVKAKDVTRQRMYLETLEKVLGGTNKIIIEEGAGTQGVVPYLPLPEIEPKRTTHPAQNGGQ